jgi:hypothetical protein
MTVSVGSRSASTVAKLGLGVGLLFSPAALEAQQAVADAAPIASTAQPLSAKQPALVLPTPGHRRVFTPQECQDISGTGVYIVRHLGNKDRLSPEFKQSWRDFLGANLDCTGPREIVWRTREDAATFNGIAGQLLLPPTRISLRGAGVDLAPAPVASLR